MTTGTCGSIPGATPEKVTKQSRGFFVRQKANGAQLAATAGLVLKGTVKVKVETVLPLPQAGKEQELSKTGHSDGKIVLSIDVKSLGVRRAIGRTARQASATNRKAEVQCWMEPGGITILMGDPFTCAKDNAPACWCSKF